MRSGSSTMAGAGRSRISTAVARRQAAPRWRRCKNEGLSEIPLRGIVPATLTVPGGVASWIAAHDAHGQPTASATVLEAAIGYAREGFPVTGRLASFIEMTREDLVRQREAAALFFPEGAAPPPGTKLTNPGLASYDLQAIADQWMVGVLSRGLLPARWLRFSQEAWEASSDSASFEAQKATWGAPLIGRYRDVTIFNTPPPTQGFTVLEMLNLVEPHQPHKMDLLGPDRLHLLVQAKQIAYHDRDQLAHRPRLCRGTGRACSFRGTMRAERGRLINPDAALRWDQVPSFGSLAGDTVYIAAVDREGNAASLIQSLYGAFGSCVVAGNTGVVLQNRGAYFSLDPIASQSARAWKNSAAHADCLDGQTRRQALERAWLHGGRWPAANPASALFSDDRFRPRYPASDRAAAISIRPLRARRSARHPVHGKPLSRGHDRRARTTRPRRPSLGARGTRWPVTPTASPSTAQTGTLSGGSDPRSDGAAIGY